MADDQEPMDCDESGISDPSVLQESQFLQINADFQQQDQHQSVINKQPHSTGSSVSQTWTLENLTYQQYLHSGQNQQSESMSPPPVNQHPLAGQIQQPESGSPPPVNQDQDKTGGDIGKPDNGTDQTTPFDTAQHPPEGQIQQSESVSPPPVNQVQGITGGDTGKPDNGTDQTTPSNTAPAEPRLQYIRNEEELEQSMHLENKNNTPTQNVTGAKNKIGMQPSAPLDTAKFNIRVEWSAPFPERWRATLHKALQRWFSLLKDKKEEYNIVKVQLLSDQNHAEVEVAPSTALDIVKEEKTATLTFKDLNQSAVVHFLLDNMKPVTVPLKQDLPVDKKKKVFMPQVDMFVNAVIDLDKWSQEVQTELLKRMGKKTGNKLSFSGSLVEVERFYREVCKIVEGAEAEMDTDAVRNDPSVEIPQNSGPTGAPPALITPLHQFWYFSHAYKKEINQIQDKFGVNIDAEVSVSVTAKDQTSGKTSFSDSVRKASDELTDLYQTNTTSLQSVTIPQTQLDSEIVKDVVRNIQLDQAKMTLMMSVDGCMLSGPKNTVSGVQSRLRESGQEFVKSVGSGAASKMEIDSNNTSGSSTLEMDIKDTPDPIVMSDALWKLMNITSSKQFTEIENKYGVHISNQPLQDSTEVKVLIKSKDNVHINLESHAHRAFIHLYQKISMSAITCPLSVPLDEKKLKNELDGHRLVGVDEKIGIWKLIGLPRNLGPAIAELEKLIGKPVFDNKTKKLIDYSENSHKFKRHNWKHLEEASSSAMGQGSSVDPDTSAKEDNEKSKDDDCPICMEKFTNEVKLKCGHGFCRDCLERSEKSLGQICSVCKKIYGKLRGNQPKGKITHSKYGADLPGYPRCGTIVITYDIPSGIQTDEHPNPGQPYYGAQRTAYLPNNAEGNEVLQLLKRAFDQRLIFTVGTSTTTGADNTVTWNDIHHKTNMTGGPQSYGYPDPDYLKRVKDELKAKGIE